ncbi:MAG: hypothetical protein ACREKI_03600 [Gemmatimonadota bacterium]
MDAKLGAVVMAGLVALGCSNSTEPVQTQDLEFLEWAPTAPLLEEYQLQFWAFAGTRSEFIIEYVGGERFLRFRLDSATLVRDAAGDTLMFGDSVQITITVDSTRFIMKFQPEGLVFNPDEEADLNIVYNHADSIFLDREAEIRPWLQERAGDPWQELMPTIWDVGGDEIEVDVLGFTRYALAVN